MLMHGHHVQDDKDACSGGSIVDPKPDSIGTKLGAWSCSLVIAVFALGEWLEAPHPSIGRPRFRLLL
jgi:hypothetical protein